MLTKSDFLSQSRILLLLQQKFEFILQLNIMENICNTSVEHVWEGEVLGESKPDKNWFRRQ